jgi:hypothetical protein
MGKPPRGRRTRRTRRTLQQKMAWSGKRISPRGTPTHSREKRAPKAKAWAITPTRREWSSAPGHCPSPKRKPMRAKKHPPRQVKKQTRRMR